MTSLAVSKTPYMCTEKTVLASGSAANTVAALFRIVNDQSCPQLGASTMIWLRSPFERSFWIAAEVSEVQLLTLLPLPNGSLPMFSWT